MSEQNLEFVTDEISFYMEKIFQFSFAYVGALIAAIAGAKVDFYENIVSLLDSTPEHVLSVIIMFLNLVYLFLSCSSTFAILKRGLFIYTREVNPHTSIHIEWERFNRIRTKKFSVLAWNVDNYYSALILVFCFLLSGLLFSFAISTSKGLIQALIIAIMSAHAIPLWSLVQIYRINREFHS